jgi:hypothetical protein
MQPPPKLHTIWLPWHIYLSYEDRPDYFVFLFNGATAPRGPGPPHYRGFTITDTPHSVGFPWASDQLVAETSTWQHTTLTRDIHASGGIRTCNPSKQAAADPLLRQRVHWHRPFCMWLLNISSQLYWMLIITLILHKINLHSSNSHLTDLLTVYFCLQAVFGLCNMQLCKQFLFINMPNPVAAWSKA